MESSSQTVTRVQNKTAENPVKPQCYPLVPVTNHTSDTDHNDKEWEASGKSTKSAFQKSTETMWPLVTVCSKYSTAKHLLWN